MRPTLKEIAKARADAERMLLGQPVEKPSEVLKTLLRATAPPTKEEAIPIMIANANTSGGWPPKPTDLENAEFAIAGDASDMTHSWVRSVWSQWQTLIHFCGGAS
jgi:hypothetical protein